MSRTPGSVVRFAIGVVLIVVPAAFGTLMICAITQERVFPAWWFGPVLTVCFLVTLVGSGLTISDDRVENDRSLLPAFSLLFLGGAVGTAIAALIMPVIFAWPLGLLVIAAILALVWWIKRRRITAILRDGRRIEGVFARVERGSHDGTSEFEEVRYAVTFPDESGVRREIEGATTFPSGNIPRPGDAVTVWHDRSSITRHLIRVVTAEDAEG